jgi:hypothetical protein
MASEDPDEATTVELVKRFGENLRQIGENITELMEEGEWENELIATVLVFAAYVDGMNEPEDKAVTLRGIRGIFEKLSKIVNLFDKEAISEYLDKLIWRADVNAYSLAESRNLIMKGSGTLFDTGDDNTPN